MKKLFVWDFHGVLEKGNDHAVHEISNLALEQHGYSRRMTLEESFALSGKRWYEYFSFLLPHLEEQVHFDLQTTCFEISKNQPSIMTKHIRLNDHAQHVLELIHNSKHCQILISNSLPAALDLFVPTVGIEKYFPPTHRFGAATHVRSGITKQHCLNDFLQDNTEYHALVSIGDSPGDMAFVHKELPIKKYLYSHPERPHRHATCDYKINDLREILRELQDASQIKT